MQNKDGSTRRSGLQNSVISSGGLVKLDGATIDYDEKEKKWLLNGNAPGKRGNLSNLSQALKKVVAGKNKDGLNDTTYRLGLFLQKNGYIFNTQFSEENNLNHGR